MTCPRCDQPEDHITLVYVPEPFDVELELYSCVETNYGPYVVPIELLQQLQQLQQAVQQLSVFLGGMVMHRGLESSNSRFYTQIPQRFLPSEPMNINAQQLENGDVQLTVQPVQQVRRIIRGNGSQR